MIKAREVEWIGLHEAVSVKLTTLHIVGASVLHLRLLLQLPTIG